MPRHSLAMSNEPSPPLPLLALRLQAPQLEAMRRFYRETIGLSLIAETATSISFRAGHTTLTFEQRILPDSARSTSPFYHFAFNIPENRLAEALEWARARVPIVRRHDGDEVFHFEAWDAHAFYFLDPAGNIVEFIARHTLNNASSRAFGSESIGDVSEIGLVVPDVAAAIDATRTLLGATPYLDRRSDEFTAVGDERGLFILVKRGRLWFPFEGEQARAAAVFPTVVTTRGVERAAAPFAGLPYEIRPESRAH